MKDIHARTPIDRVARRVTSEGERYVPDKKLTAVHSDAPLPMRPVPPTRRDLRDMAFGWLTVIGLAVARKAQRRNGGTLWVCRCVCGRYVHRTEKAIRNPRNDVDSCDMCKHTRFLRRTASESNG